MEKRFYVYIYLDPRKPGKFTYGKYEFSHEPFYIGKGTNHRWKDVKHHNMLVKRKVEKIKKTELEPIFLKIKEHITEERSFILEKYLVKKIGRFDCGKGPLFNLCDGGDRTEGMSYMIRQILSIKNKGKKHSEETKKKLSSYKGPLNHNFGVPMSEDQKKKLSDANKGQIRTEEARRKMSIAKKGKPNPNIWKTHQKNTGKKRPPEVMKNTILGLKKAWGDPVKRKQWGEAISKGKKKNPVVVSEETRQKQSVSAKLGWEKRRNHGK